MSLLVIDKADNGSLRMAVVLQTLLFLHTLYETVVLFRPMSKLLLIIVAAYCGWGMRVTRRWCSWASHDDGGGLKAIRNRKAELIGVGRNKWKWNIMVKVQMAGQRWSF